MHAFPAYMFKHFFWLLLFYHCQPFFPTLEFSCSFQTALSFVGIPMLLCSLCLCHTPPGFLTKELLGPSPPSYPLSGTHWVARLISDGEHFFFFAQPQSGEIAGIWHHAWISQSCCSSNITSSSESSGWGVLVHCCNSSIWDTDHLDLQDHLDIHSEFELS